MPKLKKMLKAALFGSMISFISHGAALTVDQVCSQINNEFFDKSFANVFLVLDYSGSMNWKIYNDGYSYYNPHKIYFGYFDPLALYKVKYVGDYPVWEKTTHCSFWDTCYIGNYLNWYFTSRIDLERLILTGGKTRYITASYGIVYLVYEINSDLWNKWITKHPRLIKRLRNWFIIEVDNQKGIVRLKRPLKWPMVRMCSFLNEAGFMKKHIKHRFCHLLPSGLLKHACINNEINVYCSTDIEKVQGERVIVLENKDRWGNLYKTYLKVSDAITYNPRTGNVEGLLQKIETFNVKPRIGALLFAADGNDHITKAWIYPTYDYTNLITTINKIEPDGGTPTGAALNEVKNYFSLNNGTFDTFATSDTDYVNPYEFTVNNQTVTVENAKNSVVLISDGAWNGYRYYNADYIGGGYKYEPYKIYEGKSLIYGDNVCDKGGVLVRYPLDTNVNYACAIDPVIPVYEMWKAGKADLVSSIPGNQNADTYTIGAFIDNTSLGANALKNIALYGSTKDNSTYYYTPPKPACDIYHSPHDWGSCGSFIYPPTHINSNGNPPHYYNAKNGLKLYASLYKVLNDRMQKLANIACVNRVIGFPNYSLYHMVTTLLTEINQNINNYDPTEIKEFVRDLVELEKEDLAPIAGSSNNLDAALDKIDNSSSIEDLRNAINNALSTISVAYNQAIHQAVENYVATINQKSSISSTEAENILNQVNQLPPQEGAQIAKAVISKLPNNKDKIEFIEKLCTINQKTLLQTLADFYKNDRKTFKEIIEKLKPYACNGLPKFYIEIAKIDVNNYKCNICCSSQENNCLPNQNNSENNSDNCLVEAKKDSKLLLNSEELTETQKKALENISTYLGKLLAKCKNGEETSPPPKPNPIPCFLEYPLDPSQCSISSQNKVLLWLEY